MHNFDSTIVAAWAHGGAPAGGGFTEDPMFLSAQAPWRRCTTAASSCPSSSSSCSSCPSSRTTSCTTSCASTACRWGPNYSLLNLQNFPICTCIPCLQQMGGGAHHHTRQLLPRCQCKKRMHGFSNCCAHQWPTTRPFKVHAPAQRRAREACLGTAACMRPCRAQST